MQHYVPNYVSSCLFSLCDIIPSRVRVQDITDNKLYTIQKNMVRYVSITVYAQQVFANLFIILLIVINPHNVMFLQFFNMQTSIVQRSVKRRPMSSL